MIQKFIFSGFCLPVFCMVLLTGCGETPPPPEKPRLIREFVEVPLAPGLERPKVQDLLTEEGTLKAVGTADGLMMPRADGSWELIDLGGRKDRKITCLTSGKSGQLYVGTVDGMYEAGSGRGFLYHDIGHVLSMVTTPDGVIWCGTKVGLRVLRGRDWQVYRKGNSSGGVSSNGLPHDEVRHLAVDDKGHLWAGTVQGVVCFDESGGMKLYTGSTYVPLVTGGLVVQPGNTAMEGNTVTRMICMGEEMLIATNRGISRTKQFQGFELFSADSQEPAKLADGSLGYRKVKGNCPLVSNFVRDMSISSDGRLLIGAKQGISLYSFADGTWETILPGTLGFTGGAVNVIRPAAEGGFWAGTDRGLQRLVERYETVTAPEK